MTTAASNDGMRTNRAPRTIRGNAAQSIHQAAAAQVEAQQIEIRAAKLLERHPHFRGRDRWVTCRYIDQNLCLVGCVPSFYLKQLAQEALRELDGIQVKNQLVVVRRPRNGIVPRETSTALEANMSSSLLSKPR